MVKSTDRQLLVWGQAKLDVLRASHVSIAGLGGLGCVVAEQLARSGVGKLTLLDSAFVDLPDLGRQVLYSKHNIGQAKVRAAAERLESIAPGLEIFTLQQSVESVQENMGNPDNAMFLSANGFADCLDNYHGRFALEEILPKGAFMVHAGIQGEIGQVTTIIAGGALSLRKIFAGARQPSSPIPVIPQACSVVGGYQSLAVLNNLWWQAGLLDAENLPYTLRSYLCLFDIACGTHERIPLI